MEESEEKLNKNDGCLDGCAGCGCLIVLLCIAFSIISWAFHIHWLFGLIILLIVLNWIFN